MIQRGALIDELPLLLTYGEVALWLGRSKRTVERMVRRGTLPTERPDNRSHPMISRESLRGLVDGSAATA